MSPLQFWLNGLTDDEYYLWRLSRHSQAFSLLLRPQHLTPTGPQHRKWQTLHNPAFGLASSQTTKTHQSWLGWQKQLSSLWCWARLLAKDKTWTWGCRHPAGLFYFSASLFLACPNLDEDETYIWYSMHVLSKQWEGEGLSVLGRKLESTDHACRCQQVQLQDSTTSY